MSHSSFSISLMLIDIILLLLLSSFGHSHKHGHLGHWRLAGREEPTTTSALSFAAAATPCTGPDCVGALPASTNLPCDNLSGTTLVAGSENSTWVMLCNTDFYAQDIYPFILAGSFEDCLQSCVNYDTESEGTGCAGFVYAPDRLHEENDCYLKSSVNDMVYPSTIHLIAATLVPPAVAPSATATSSLVTAPGKTGPEAGCVSTPAGPVIKEVKALGTSNNEPTKQYVKHTPASPIKLATRLLQPGINLDLINDYPLARDTGSWTSDSFVIEPDLADMTIKPRLSRDGGKGGIINGTHVFIFCDTSTFGETESAMGYMNGFVSSSAAVALRQNGTDEEALTLQDPLGQWQDDVGRLRGWIEMTTGEEAFNVAVSGDGFRYAVWPESGFIPLNASHSLIWAPLVYVEVNMTTQDATFTSLGNSLVSVYIDPKYGPHADRLVNQLFGEDEVEWGSLGGLRAWGASGNGTIDGMIYLFGQVDAGVLVAKVSPLSITDRSTYTYWNGSAWSDQIQPRNSTAYLIKQSVMDFDIFYSPYHKYFFMVYLTPYADNTFWMRWLQGPEPLYPPYMEGGQADYAEYILRYDWSEPAIMWKAPTPAIGYIYAGGIHTGYYGAADIAYGGNYLLVTWTEHTEKDPNDPSSGYRHRSARITLT